MLRPSVNGMFCQDFDKIITSLLRHNSNTFYNRLYNKEMNELDAVNKTHWEKLRTKLDLYVLAALGAVQQPLQPAYVARMSCLIT